MTPQQHLEHLAADSARFASSTAGALDQHIGHLDWSVRDLVAHLGAVYAYATANAANPSTEFTPTGPEAKPQGDESINSWFAERRAVVLETLSSLDDDVPVWTHAGVQTGKWWKRRMACETAIHRWDGDSAIHGEATEPIDGDLATDGVNEFLEVSLDVAASRGDRTFPTSSLHLHRSDGPGEWMLATNEQGELVITEEHGKGDAAVRGPASDLMLWIWGRPTNGVEIFGDEAVAASWQALSS